MKVEHAKIVVELLANAGYLDDADELLGDRLENAGEEETRRFASEMDNLIAECNAVLPEDERVTGRTMIEEVDLLI